MKINIIGAGVSGMAMGCYLQMNGFETEIFEKQSSTGGLCTSWKRGDFTFDGCVQWLLGSSDSSPFYRLWSELIDMKSLEFVNHNIRVDIELEHHHDRHGGKVFHLYTNLVELESYLLELAPEDTGPIKDLIKSMRIMQRYELPPLISDIPSLQPFHKKVAMMTYLPFAIMFLKWKNITNYSFARRLKNPFLKEAFELLMDGDEFKLLIMTLPLSFFDKKGAGYPVGGSFKFAKHIEEKYISLGGKIRLNAEVKKILNDGKRAGGILLKDDTIHLSDITISATDWHYTVFEALDGKFVNNKILALSTNRKLKLFPSVFLVSLGVTGSFREYPHLLRFPLGQALTSPDGTIYKRLESHIYHYDPTLAPEGRTVIALSIYTRRGDYWIDLRNNNKDEYNRVKVEFADHLIDRLDERIPGVRQAIEVIDIATPATYNRYTNNWQGSVQGWFPDNNLIAASPVNISLPGLSDFYFCSHWLTPGGGLPMAIKAGRDLSQKICIKYKKKFIIR